MKAPKGKKRRKSLNSSSSNYLIKMDYFLLPEFPNFSSSAIFQKIRDEEKISFISPSKHSKDKF